METKTFLSSVESKAYRTFYTDGLMDIFFGLLLIGVGCNVLRLRMGMDTSTLITLAVLLLIPAFILSRLYITRPRLGYVRFGEKRKRRKALALLIAVLTQMIFGFLLWMTFRNNSNDQLLQKFFNPYTEFFFIVIVFSLIGYLIDYNRLYLIGFAVGIGLRLSDALENVTQSVVVVSLSFGIAGLFLTALGLILLVRFLHDYPKPGIQTEHEKE